MSLFGDSSDQGLLGKSDPWATGSGGGRRVSDLLANAAIPPGYSGLYDETLHAGGGQVPLSAFSAVLDRSGLAPEQKERVMWVVTRELGVVGNVPLNVWNIAMALVGLAQQGEEIDLKTVDAFRNKLPIVSLGEPRISLNTGSTISATSTFESSTGWEDNAPAESFEQTSIVSNGNGIEHIHTPLPSETAPLLTPGGQEPAWTAKTADPTNYQPSARDTINVQLVPEREGMFMFRHVVYILEGHIPTKADEPFKVVRRYSDFLWLLECLVKMYPFRLLPVLPPKRLTVDGNYLSSDTSFLERRRRGLSRFVNQLVKHPVLRNEQLVIMFLTVDTELSIWRKQSNLSIEEEFTQRVISPAFVAEWNQQLEMDKWRALNEAVGEALQAITHMCHLMDRIAKRKEAMALDIGRFSTALSGLDSGLNSLFTLSIDDLPAIRTGMRSATRHLSNMADFYGDESKAVDIGILEDLKLFRDMLSSIREMFVRVDRLGGNSIVRLQKRIEANEERLRVMATKPEPNSSEMAKIRQGIANDKSSIQRQTNRDWLIKECITDEIVLAQKMQYQVSRFLRDWSIDNLKYSELHTETWTHFNDEVSELPQDA